jgi:DNA-binding MarR family transcriptional regulator
MEYSAKTASASSLDQMAEEIFALNVMGWRDRVASKQHGTAELSESQYLTIDTLVHAAGILTVGEIQRSIGVLPAQMSRIIRSLESSFDSALIKCELNQTDKRKIDVRLTPEGHRVYEEFRRARLSKTVEILKKLTEHDRLEFVRVCSRIRELLHAEGPEAPPLE